MAKRFNRGVYSYSRRIYGLVSKNKSRFLRAGLALWSIDKNSVYRHSPRFCLQPSERLHQKPKAITQKDHFGCLDISKRNADTRYWGFFELSPSVPTSPASIQQRAKIIPEAFEYLFHRFTASTDKHTTCRGLRPLAVDRSDLRCATNPDDPDSFPEQVGNFFPQIKVHAVLTLLTRQKRWTSSFNKSLQNWWYTISINQLPVLPSLNRQKGIHL